MPKISEFFGIAIYMNYNDHNPPHFHARYAGAGASIDIASLRVLRGTLHPRARGLVTEWAALHQPELLHVWQQARRGQPLDQIEPLA